MNVRARSGSARAQPVADDRAPVAARSQPAGGGRHGVPHGSRGAIAYSRLRDAIQEGRFKPGERIMENEVAEWLDVSRTPVRDAIRRLEAEGILQHEARSGLVVARLDRQA